MSIADIVGSCETVGAAEKNRECTAVREYVGSMSSELARMARGQGDEKLACILDVAAEIALNRLSPVTG